MNIADTIKDLNEKQLKYTNREIPLVEVLKVLKDAGFEEEKPYAEDGKFCSECGSQVEVEFDEDWDVDPENNTCNFVTLPYLFCPKCRIRLSMEG